MAVSTSLFWSGALQIILAVVAWVGNRLRLVFRFSGFEESITVGTSVSGTPRWTPRLEFMSILFILPDRSRLNIRTPLVQVTRQASASNEPRAPIMVGIRLVGWALPGPVEANLAVPN